MKHCLLLPALTLLPSALLLLLKKSTPSWIVASARAL